MSLTHTEIRSTKDIGQAIKAVRKWQHLRQDEVGSISHTFILDLEAGKPTAQIGKVLEALRELGIRLHLQLPSRMPIPPLNDVP
jgi:hypothetical protein